MTLPREFRNAAVSLALSALLGMSAAHAHAEEAPRSEPEEAQADRDDSDAPPDKSEDTPPSREIFIPTEEISEDFAVSFPVDI